MRNESHWCLNIGYCLLTWIRKENNERSTYRKIGLLKDDMSGKWFEEKIIELVYIGLQICCDA